MRKKFIHTKKSQIFAVMIVIATFITCGFAIFKFITVAERFGNVVIAPSYLYEFYSELEKFKFFIEESARLSIVQSYYEIARDGEFVDSNCLYYTGYYKFCEFNSDLKVLFTSKVKENLNKYIANYNLAKIVNLSNITYNVKLDGEIFTIYSNNTILTLDIKNIHFPYSVAYLFNHSIILNLTDIGLHEFREIYDQFNTCKEEKNLEKIKKCMQELQYLRSDIVNKSGILLFTLTTKKEFLVKENNNIVYIPILIKFSS